MIEWNRLINDNRYRVKDMHWHRIKPGLGAWDGVAHHHVDATETVLHENIISARYTVSKQRKRIHKVPRRHTNSHGTSVLPHADDDDIISPGDSLEAALCAFQRRCYGQMMRHMPVLMSNKAYAAAATIRRAIEWRVFGSAAGDDWFAPSPIFMSYDNFIVLSFKIRLPI